MKNAGIASYRFSSSGGDRNPFDAAKFEKQINSKNKISWWQGFLQSLERKRRKIHRELLMLAQQEKVRNHN